MQMVRLTKAAGMTGLALCAGAVAWASLAPDKPVSGPPPGLSLVPSFAEEFDGNAVDRRRWIFAYYDPAREQPTVAKRSLSNNRERQVYVDPEFLGLGLDPFRVAAGSLTIRAEPLSDAARTAVQAAVASQPPRTAGGPLRDLAYSSGMISSRGRFAQTYGYFEMRARWSAGKGLWPAFWLLPATGGWPPEIDILEAHGDKPDTAFHSIHSKVAASVTKKVTAPGADQAFHTYGMLWTPATIDYFIDGTRTASLPTPGDMKRPMYLIANLAVGGRWPGDPDAATAFPATMEIDYIRAWKFTATP